MYNKKAELFHLPRALMVESSRPACAAAVAAPILKLCPACLSCSKPTADRAFLISAIKRPFVSGLPFLSRKNGPGESPLSAVYVAIASIGHSSLPDRPTNTSTPFPN